MYANQREIGEALKEIGAKREELFITSKIWHTHMERDQVLSQYDECLNQLQMDHVDLLLIHSPNHNVPYEETLGAFKEIFDAGKAKSIGISNFNSDQVDRARNVSALPISANQVEYNVHYNREELLRHCTKHHIHVTAHRPLAKGKIGDERLLNDIAKSSVRPQRRSLCAGCCRRESALSQSPVPENIWKKILTYSIGTLVPGR